MLLTQCQHTKVRIPELLHLLCRQRPLGTRLHFRINILEQHRQQDMYGYEMAQAMRERSHEKFTLLETSMYPTLYRLQDNGYISAREELVGKRRKRTYYHLEPAGRAYFQKIFAEYMTVQQGVQEILASCQKEVTDIVQ